MKVLLIGGSGFLGSHITPRLLQAGHTVTVLSRTPKLLPEWKAAGVQAFSGDLLQPASRLDQVPFHDVLILIAMPPIKPGQRINRKKFEELRALTTGFFKTTLALGRRLKCPMILTSGASFHTTGDQVADESRPVQRFGMASIGEEIDSLIEQAMNAADPPVIVPMPGQIYGPGGLFLMMYNMMKSGRFRVLGSGTNRIPRIYVADAADAYVKILDKMPLGERFILADNYACTAREFGNELARLMGRPVPGSLPAFILRMAIGKLMCETAMMDCRVSNAKARRELGWEPQHPTYREGLAATVEALNAPKT